MRTAISPMLVRLAEERATGVLIRERGTLYLADGQVVHAESPAAPGIDDLLVAAGRLPRAGWEEAVARAGARRTVGRFLVDSGRLADGELEICHLGALFDAAFFALSPSSGPTRFRYGVSHWIGPVRPVPAAVVARESSRRRALLAAIWPYPDIDSAPVVPRAPTADRRIPDRQRGVLSLADGVRTPEAIARALGRPAFHTLIEVRRLAASGLVETPAAPTPPPAPPSPVPLAGHYADPDTALLRRLRDALEESL
ncbi:hypothetical protein [Streptomyces sclerotialus]|uniref:hypothetical protein n=1 Tax=Streptomyces sclerotialus TaxID=1957 RepID=UPI0004CAB8F7